MPVPFTVAQALDELARRLAVVEGVRGVSSVDFGAFPGSSNASLAVTGQTGILATSQVKAWVAPVATADHTADEHLVEPLRAYAGNIVAGTGFTLYLVYGAGPENMPDAEPGDGALPLNNNAPRPYGLWSVGWEWRA